jgi:hypothetical protein
MEELAMGIVQPPTGGLIGYSNYNLTDNCENLTGVSVSVDVTQEMIATPSGPLAAGTQSYGIGFQLNCQPPAGGRIIWQQYILVVSRTGEDLRWGVNNWDTNPADTDGIIDQGGHLATLPSSFGPGYASIPAGYRFQIALINDANDNITGATFSMYDPEWQPRVPATDGYADIPNRCPREPSNGGRSLANRRHRFRHSRLRQRSRYHALRGRWHDHVPRN